MVNGGEKKGEGKYRSRRLRDANYYASNKLDIRTYGTIQETWPIHYNNNT